MKKEVVISAKSVEEAVALAVKELGAPSEDKIEYTVLEEAKKGFLGLGSTDAKISASYTCGGEARAIAFVEKLLADMAQDPKPKILLGVTYALLELAEQYAPKLANTIVMETGGMKGRRAELPKAELHRILCEAFGVEKIHSEYGMAELLSQGYSFGDGVFRTPRWMRVYVRDVNNPFSRPANGRRGALDIIDLANRDSCAFIATQDMGIRYDDGSFRIEGRIAQSDIRGCNLLVQ